MLAHGASRGAAKWFCLRSHACLLQTRAVSAGQPGPCEGMPPGPAMPTGLSARTPRSGRKLDIESDSDMAGSARAVGRGPAGV